MNSDTAINKILEEMIALHIVDPDNKEQARFYIDMAVCIGFEIKPEKNSHVEPVTQYGRHGNQVARYGSIKEAALATGILATNIGLACNGKQKTAGGFKWKKTICE